VLRTNLSTRPFYNERAVAALLAALGLALGLALAYDAQQGIVLSQKLTQFSRQAALDEQRAQALRADAARLQAGISPAELKEVQDAADEANTAIDGRTFSWTSLLNEIEATLPNGVMMTAIRPSLDEDGVVVNMAVVARNVSDIGRFMDRLEQSGSFVDVLSTAEQTSDDGRIQSNLTGRYRYHRATAAAGGGR